VVLRRMRVVFMGSPEFAAPVLEEIVRHGHHVVAVYTRAPKAGGRRGLEIVKTAVHELSDRLGLQVLTPHTLRDPAVQDEFQRHGADVAVVAAYGLLLPPPILAAPKYGCVNLHASLLPRWRGAAPVQRAIMAGDCESGVDLMRMEEGLDTGPIALRERVPIRPSDTAGDLTRALSRLAASLVARGLEAIADGALVFRAQAESGVCYARRIAKTEAEIDWSREAAAIRNHVHGLSPTPGAYSFGPVDRRIERIKLLRAEAVDSSGPPGVVLDRSFTVACGRGALRVVEAQRAGKIPMPGAEVQRGMKIEPGMSLVPSSAPPDAT